MRRALAVAVSATCTLWSLGARAQYAPVQSPPQQQYPAPQPYPAQPQYPTYPAPQPAPAAPAWNPFLPQQPAGATPYGPYQGPSATQQQLDLSEKESSGRGLEVAWAVLDVGPTLVGLDALGGKLDAQANHQGGVGGATALTIGARFLTWTLGVRGGFLATGGSFGLWNVGLEAGYHLPVGRADPFVVVRGGYFGGRIAYTSGTLYPGPAGPGQATNDAIVIGGPPGDAGSLHGWDVGLAVGDDYYLTPAFSLGAEIGAQTLFVSEGTGESATGLEASIRLRVGLHFDL